MSDGRHYPKHPRVGLGVVVWREDDVLLIQRGKPPNMGKWSLPGGGQNLGETVFDGAAREVLEETGVTVTPMAVVDVVDSIHRDGTGVVEFHYTLVEVLATYVSGDPVASDDAMDARWVPYEELESYVEWGETLRIIRQSREIG